MITVIGQLLIAILVGVLMGALLGWLVWRQWLPRHEKRQLEKQQRQQQRGILDSLEVLCRVLDQQQMEISEGVIRLSALMDSLPEHIAPKVDVAAIHRLAAECNGFARGEARQAMSARQRHQQDSQRWTLEEQQQQVVIDAVHRLQEVLPVWRTQLGLNTDDKDKHDRQ